MSQQDATPVGHPPGRHYDVRGHRLCRTVRGRRAAGALLQSRPALQQQFTEYAPQIRLEFLEKSGSFSHVEEPAAVFGLVREFTSR